MARAARNGEDRRVTICPPPHSASQVSEQGLRTGGGRPRKRTGHRIKCMTRGCLDVPDFRMATTAALSQRQRTVFPRQLSPHRAQATTTGNSSFTVICTAAHRNWNHSPADKKAQHPQEPEASDVTTTEGGVRTTPDNTDSPFQSSRNRSHHCRSDRKARLRRIR